jgi:hypothetical protein
MRFAKTVLVAVIVAAVAAYAVDCSAAVSPEQAMQCCKTMPCSPQGSSQNCCKTMPDTHAPFVQQSSLHRVSLSALAMAVLPAHTAHFTSASLASDATAHCHAPPGLSHGLNSSPLRI